MPTAFVKTSPALAFDKALGLCFGWLCFSKKEGVDYVDLHGDHFPDDELLTAADALMAKAASERLINVEHAGGGRGEIRTVYALTEDVAKAQGIDTGGTYGLVGSFKPDAELMKSIAAGAMFCLSIEGTAGDVVEVAKAAGDVAATAHKRTMRKVSLSKLAVVSAGAHEGASVALIKSAAAALQVAKAAVHMTSAIDGHQHLVHVSADPDEKAGYTSYETATSTAYGAPYGHSHPWVKADDGTLTIGEANGHSHTLDTEQTDMTTADIAKAQADLTAAKAVIAKHEGRTATLLALTPDQFTFAKGLAGDKLEAFLAKSDAERTVASTPVYKSTATGDVFFASDDQRLVAMAKSRDADAIEIAKAREQVKDAEFAKRAQAEIPHLAGDGGVHVELVKAVDGIADPAKRAAAHLVLKGANAAMGGLMKPPGYGGPVDPIVKSAQGELDAMTADIAKREGLTFAKAMDKALATPAGARLYDQIEAAKRPAAGN